MLQTRILHTREIPVDQSVIHLLVRDPVPDELGLDSAAFAYVLKMLGENEDLVAVNSFVKWTFVLKVEEKENTAATLEGIRRLAHKLNRQLRQAGLNTVYLADKTGDAGYIEAFIEGLILSSYRFQKYLGKKDEKQKATEILHIFSDAIDESGLSRLVRLLEGVYSARDLVNEPLSFLTAVQLGKEFEKLGKEAGFSVEVFNKKKIESLRMGGLLAVNKGSIDPPTFTVMEWKPTRAVNKKPLVLVGKGVVYDTGGLSLKPTKDSMDAMKCDMSGAAAVAGAIYAIAANKLPLHLIALVPATDNRPDGNAYVPGDIITMYDGTTVEVLNTDAEGRLILADALSYARRYDPELVIELSTLTGTAHMAIGTFGMVGMWSREKSHFIRLQECGEMVYERVVEFPLWEEYREQLTSEIADLKNIGGKEGGASSAGKFLEHFTSYPFIHLDIAGPAFLIREDHYKGKGGSGVGVRLLYRFLESLSAGKQ